MQVAFISECTTFYRILSTGLSSIYPALSFVHYAHPDLFLKEVQPGFSHFIMKLTDQEKFDLKIKAIKKKYSSSIIIGLIINREFKTLKSIQNSFDYLFSDNEIEEKLSVYFESLFPKKLQVSKLSIDQNKSKYIHLNTIHSRCLLLVSQHKTAKEIALELSKSERTVEKYISFLRHYFEVKQKRDLIKIVKEIAEN
jgi:DNA-binding NarL/FixJ family response regulator